MSGAAVCLHCGRLIIQLSDGEHETVGPWITAEGRNRTCYASPDYPYSHTPTQNGN